MSPRIIDLSHPLSPDTPAFPGDPPIDLQIIDAADRPSLSGERHLNCSRISVTVHCGTHMDAPFHFFSDRQTIDAVPLSRCIGPAAIANVTSRSHPSHITIDDLLPFRDAITRTRRLLINSGWHHHWNRPGYFTDHPVFDDPTARWIVDQGVQLIGVDFPSVDRPPFPAHLVFLSSDVLIVENLTGLDELRSPIVEFSALPLKILGRDGSPVRAIATLPT